VRDAFAESTRHARFGWLWTIANWTVKLAAQAWLLAALIPAGLDIGAAGALGPSSPPSCRSRAWPVSAPTKPAPPPLLPSGVPLASGLQVALALHLFVIACAVSSGAIAWLFPAGEAPKPTAAPQSGLQSAPSAAPEARARSSAE
jgi:hypothetical protein